MKKICGNGLRTVPMIIGLLALSVAAPVSFAEQGPAEKEGKRNGLFKELNLTEEQEAKLGEYRKQDLPERKKTMETMRESRKKLMEELGKPISDPTEIERLSAEVKKSQGQMLDQHIKSVTHMKEVLTPEQFQKFQEKIKEKHGKNKERRMEMMDKTKDCAQGIEKE